MTPLGGYFIALVIFGAVVLSAAQEPISPSVQSQNNGAEPAVVDDLRAPAPALLGGASSSLAFSSELERSNYLRGGISVGATYDDNAASSATTRIGDLSYSILPNI